MTSRKIHNLRMGLCVFSFLIMLTLKLADIGIVSNWSWWWIFSPLWGALVLGIIIGIITGLASYLKYKFRAKKYEKQKDKSDTIYFL